MTTDAGLEVEVYVPHQRAASPLVFRAEVHRDTPGADLLDASHYCRGCGLCLCSNCQAITETKEQ